MKFDPEYRSTTGTYQPGIYDFVVVFAQDRPPDKYGHESIELNISVIMPGMEKPFDRKDWLSPGNEKFFSFFQVSGHDPKTGELTPDDCIGVKGRVELVMGKPKKDGKSYLQVKKYLPAIQKSGLGL